MAFEVKISDMRSPKTRHHYVRLVDEADEEVHYTPEAAEALAAQLVYAAKRAREKE